MTTTPEIPTDIIEAFSDSLTDEVTPTTAFEKSAVLLWKGQVLRPFSGRRLIAAQACGLKIFKLAATDAEAVSAYDGIFYDAVLTVYLCASPNSESLLAVRRPATVAESALTWADGQDLSPTSPDFADLLALFGQIMQEITASTSEPVPQATDPAQKKIS